MKCIYEIKYEIQWESTEPTHWEAQQVRVLSDEDATAAVDRAKKTALAQQRLDDNGRQCRCTGFRLRGVELIAEAAL